MSPQQLAALTALRGGPLATPTLASLLALAFHACSWMLKALADRGLVHCSRVRASGPSRFVWRLTSAGLRAVEAVA